MNMGLLVQDVMYGGKVHRILQEIDLFYTDISRELATFNQVIDEIRDCPSFRNLMNEVDRRVAFRIIIREMYFRYTSIDRETVFPIIIVHLLLLKQDSYLAGRSPKDVAGVAVSETVRWILIGHELGYLACPDLQEEYREILGETYRNWIVNMKSAPEALARGMPYPICHPWRSA